MDVLKWTQIAGGEALETVASYPIGQVVLKQVDNFLWLLEKSSQWALPPPCADDGDKTMVVSELIRPLPWILFLPILVLLRIARESISFGALMMGKDPIRPSSIVKFIQNSRRSLRAIKYEGLRYMRCKTQNISSSDKHHFYISSWVAWIIEKIQSLTCYRIVKYSNGEKPSMITKRTNSGDKFMVKESTCKSPQSPTSRVEEEHSLDDSAALLQSLLSNLEQFVETDSEDSDYSVKNEGTQTSDTSSSNDTDGEDDIGENEVEEYYQPEDEQNSSRTNVKTNGVKDKQASPPQVDATKEDALTNGIPLKKMTIAESLKKFIETEKQMSAQSERKVNPKSRSKSKSPKSRSKSKSPNKTPKISPKKAENQAQVADSNSLPVVMVTPAAESPNKSTTIIHATKNPGKKQHSPHHDRH